MSNHGNEAELVSEAGRLIAAADGEDATEEVLAAGVFSLQNLLVAQMAGAAAGGTITDAVISDHGMASALGAVAGQRVAVEAAAEAQGVSVVLIVAVTGSTIRVLSREGSGHPPQLARFDRPSTEVTVRKFGLSRIVTLRDGDSGAEVTLHASVSPLSAQSKPDKLVLGLLG